MEEKKTIKKRRKKIEKNKKPKKINNIVALIAGLVLLGVGGFFAREYFLQKNAEEARESLRQYNVSVLRKVLSLQI